MDRRSFVRSVSALSGAALGGASTLSLGACGGLAYLTPIERDGTLRVPAAAVTPSGVSLKTRSMDRAVFVHTGADGEAVALLARCTHRGCQPDPVGDRLVCPCHGSEFSLAGEVLQGPAERPLVRYEVTRDGDDLVVWTSARRPR